MPRLYSIRFRVGYSLGDRGIFWDILYMITIYYKCYIEKFSRTIIKKMHQLIILRRGIIYCTPIIYLSGGLLLSLTLHILTY